MKPAIKMLLSALGGAAVATLVMYTLLADEKSKRERIEANFNSSVGAVRMNWDMCEDKLKAEGSQFSDLLICVWQSRRMDDVHVCLQEHGSHNGMNFGAPGVQQ